MPTPYTTEPMLLESLRGQQYVVLRPLAGVARFYEREQSDALARLPDGTPHPITGHVTLRGFFEPERVASLRDVVAAWAGSTPPIEVRIDAVDGFPPPFQILITRLARTDSLVEAYSRLTDSLDATDFRRIGELPLDDWVFHISLAYAGGLSEIEWSEALAAIARNVPSPPNEIVSCVDFVWYDETGEHIDSFPLARS